MYISNKNAFIMTIFLFLEQASMVHPTVNIIQQNILLVYFIVYIQLNKNIIELM